jgi:acyl phosphate:glycerol-3-phosphate acyltransferase
MILPFLLVLLIGYLIGSFPSGYLAGRMAGLDIRQHGSGNIGATNVLRTLGKKAGYAVFFADALKGFCAVWTGFMVARAFGLGAPYEDWLGIVAALFCVVGHSFPVWLKFKGGKGVATSAGTMIGLAPLATLFAVVVWFSTFLLTRYVSIASVAAAVALPAAIGLTLKLRLTNSTVLFYAAVAIAAVVCWRHRTNIVRLIQGTEPRFERK